MAKLNLKNIRRKKTKIEKELLDFFKTFNCKHELDKMQDENSDNIRYSFSFQGGSFFALIYGEVGVEVIYPRIFDIATDEIEMVRAQCNRFNAFCFAHKFTYQVIEDENIIAVHASVFYNTINESFEHLLKGFFNVAREFKSEYKNLTESVKSHNSSKDPERRYAANKREEFLLKQMEISHQEAERNYSFGNSEPLTIGDLASRLLPLLNHRFTNISCDSADRLPELSSHDEIAGFNVGSLVFNPSDNTLLAHNATITVKAAVPHSNQPERVFVINLNHESTTNRTHFFRVTITLVPAPTSRDNTLESHKDRPDVISFLISLSNVSATKLQQEFNYMWEDAKIKVRDGNMAELSEEQMFLAMTEQTDVASCWYWGSRHLRNKEYYQAVSFFENAYKSMLHEFYTYKSEQRERFFEICYRIGFCYYELKQYERAFFYLNITGGIGKVNYAMALVNTFASAADIRTISYIDQITEEIEQNFKTKNPFRGDDEDDDEDETEEIPEEIAHFLNFLRRRKAYSLIDFERYAEAEVHLRAMLNEEENSEFALKELAYIKQLRRDRDIPEPSPDELPF